MNKRIKELADQAGIVLWQSHLGSITHYEGRTESLEKFAELIVRECAGVAWGIYANQEIANGIKQHFGVE